MGTRGAYGFRIGRQDKVSYNHSDSYPSGLGNDIVNFIANHTPKSLKQIAEKIEMVSEEKEPTKKQIQECESWSNVSVGSRKITDWYCLLRESQGNLYAFDNGLKYMIDSKNFLLDSLFCEYAYIINVSTQKLEFYKGFNNKAVSNKGRYAKKTLDNKYYGVTLVATFPLSEICGKPENVSEIVKKMQKKTK